jgi:hypothetical protein
MEGLATYLASIAAACMPGAVKEFHNNKGGVCVPHQRVHRHLPCNIPSEHVCRNVHGKVPECLPHSPRSYLCISRRNGMIHINLLLSAAIACTSTSTYPIIIQTDIDW